MKKPSIPKQSMGIEEDQEEPPKTISQVRSGSYKESKSSSQKTDGQKQSSDNNLPIRTTKNISTATSASTTTSNIPKPPGTNQNSLLQTAIAKAYQEQKNTQSGSTTSNSQTNQINNNSEENSKFKNSGLKNSKKGYENPYLQEQSQITQIPQPDDPNIMKWQKQAQQAEKQLQEVTQVQQMQEQEIREINLEISQNQKKNLELKNQIKKQKTRITALENENDILTQHLHEKDQIISKYIQLIQNQPYDEQRCFLLSSQLIKNRRYIAHLTQILQSYKGLIFQIENQANSALAFFEREIEKGSSNKGGHISEASVEKYIKFYISIQEKLSEITKLCSYEFSSNIFREYDRTSGKQPSNQSIILELEQKCTKLMRSFKDLNNERGPTENQERIQTAQTPNSGNTIIQIYKCAEDLAYTCVQLGFDIQISEDEYEKPLNMKEIVQSAVQSFQKQLAGTDDANLVNQLLDKNSNHLKKIQEHYFDGQELIRKFREKSLFDAVFQRFENNLDISSVIGLISGVSNNPNQQNNLLSTNSSIVGSTLNNQNIIEGASTPIKNISKVSPIQTMTKVQKNMQVAQNFMQALSIALGNSAYILQKKMNLMFVSMVNSQITGLRLKLFGQELFRKIEGMIKTQIKQPFDDLIQIYEKYYLQQKNPNYPIHLAQKAKYSLFTMNKIQLQYVAQPTYSDLYKIDEITPIEFSTDESFLKQLQQKQISNIDQNCNHFQQIYFQSKNQQSS